MKKSFRSLAALLALTLAASSCSSAQEDADDPVQLDDLVLASELQAFDSCDDYLRWSQDAAIDSSYGNQMGYMLEDGADFDVARQSGGAEDAMAEMEPTALAAEADGSGNDAGATASNDESTTGTNNQEAGVDEADLTKTDGSQIVTVVGSTLHVTDIVDGLPYPSGSIVLPNTFTQSVFLYGDKVFVLGTAQSQIPIEGDYAYPMYYSGLTAVWEIDISGEPEIIDGQNIEGNLVTGRMVDGTMRIVISDNPEPIPIAEYNYEASYNDYEEYTEGLEDAVKETEVQDWLPQEIGFKGATTSLVDCENLYHPTEFAGFGTTSIMTIPGSLADMSVTSVAASAETVYASESTLYLATSTWGDFAGDPMGDEIGLIEPGGDIAWTPSTTSTEIHAIDISGTSPATYVASGAIEGRTLNQYSLSESGGYLRIATTQDGTEANDWQSHSGISVLQRDGGDLVEVGSLDGLGPNEEIQSVRFMGNTAYVVTFERTDPFYVIDLSDPTDPTAVGELKLPGFSAYLHPVGDGMVLGVGFDGNDQGLTHGAKISLFDATDPANPTEVDNWVNSDVYFSVTYDPHAFNFDEERSIALIPAEPNYCDNPEFCGESSNGGVLVFKISSNSIEQLGNVDHSDTTPSPEAPEETTTTTAPEETTTTEATTTTVDETTTTTVPETPPTTITESEELREDGNSGASTSSSDSEEPGIDTAEPLPTEPIPTEPFEPGLPDPNYVDPYLTAPTRAFVLGDTIFSVSPTGIAAHNADSLGFLGFARF